MVTEAKSATAKTLVAEVMWCRCVVGSRGSGENESRGRLLGGTYRPVRVWGKKPRAAEEKTRVCMGEEEPEVSGKVQVVEILPKYRRGTVEWGGDKRG